MQTANNTRTRKVDTRSTFRPIYVVWELTLKCDLACRHCGSRAGKDRNNELSLEEAYSVAEQLAEMGTHEVTFIGGEAYLYPEWLSVVRKVHELGITCTMTTGGRNITPTLANEMARCGMRSVSISLDGLAHTHDTLRAVSGSFKAACQGFHHLKAAGIRVHANTQINRLNLHELEELADILLAHHVTTWQLQLTGPMGRAADRPEWLLQPYELISLMPRIQALASRVKSSGLTINAANNLGYYGPVETDIRYEYWKGCGAGRHVLGIESNGDIKGCPSLPSKPYVGGNIREQTLKDIWSTKQLAFARSDRATELWGYCKSCYYASICKGGCSWTSHTLLGKRGNMPYCYHRALELGKMGIAETIEQVTPAPGEPFDFALYRLKTIPLPIDLKRHLK